MNTVEKKLAELIREHPNLYDQSRQDYKDALKGHLSWKEIAGVMGKSEEELKMKWKNLRDKYCKAKKRMTKRSIGRRLADSEENQVDRPVPVLLNQLDWLNAFVKPRVDNSGMTSSETSFPTSDHAYLAIRQSGPHITCQLRGHLPKLEICGSCCSLFHCPFCNTKIFKPTVKNKVLKHLEGHVRRAVQHKDYTIFKCNLHCKDIAHFHCPSCTKVFDRRDRLLFHLNKCVNEVDKNVITANPDATDVQKEPDTTAENMQDDILMKVAESGDDLENEEDEEKKELHLPLPLISTRFSLLEACPNNHQEMGVTIKRKRQTASEPEISSVDGFTNIRDEDELFLLSLLPSLKRLTIKKRMEVRMKFQQVLYAAEFED